MVKSSPNVISPDTVTSYVGSVSHTNCVNVPTATSLVLPLNLTFDDMILNSTSFTVLSFSRTTPPPETYIDSCVQILFEISVSPDNVIIPSRV